MSGAALVHHAVPRVGELGRGPGGGVGGVEVRVEGVQVRQNVVAKSSGLGGVAHVDDGVSAIEQRRMVLLGDEGDEATPCCHSRTTKTANADQFGSQAHLERSTAQTSIHNYRKVKYINERVTLCHQRPFATENRNDRLLRISMRLEHVVQPLEQTRLVEGNHASVLVHDVLCAAVHADPMPRFTVAHKDGRARRPRKCVDVVQDAVESNGGHVAKLQDLRNRVRMLQDGEAVQDVNGNVGRHRYGGAASIALQSAHDDVVDRMKVHLPRVQRDLFLVRLLGLPFETLSTGVLKVTYRLRRHDDGLQDVMRRHDATDDVTFRGAEVAAARRRGTFFHLVFVNPYVHSGGILTILRLQQNQVFEGGGWQGLSTRRRGQLIPHGDTRTTGSLILPPRLGDGLLSQNHKSVLKPDVKIKSNAFICFQFIYFDACTVRRCWGGRAPYRCPPFHFTFGMCRRATL